MLTVETFYRCEFPQECQALNFLKSIDESSGAAGREDPLFSLSSMRQKSLSGFDQQGAICRG
ncbi:hypothetical protein [Streptomyces sp. NBC_00096]|uniref:hypothetical protein n=1 Tax=Streptomyces sp. NBC_00096 TaxID=2975650 RepID=UPI0032488D43